MLGLMAIGASLGVCRGALIRAGLPALMAPAAGCRRQSQDERDHEVAPAKRGPRLMELISQALGQLLLRIVFERAHLGRTEDGQCSPSTASYRRQLATTNVGQPPVPSGIPIREALGAEPTDDDVPEWFSGLRR